MQHFEVLQLALDRAMPARIADDSRVPIGIVGELVDAGLLSGINVSSFSERAYIDVAITIAGRRYLQDMARSEAQEESLTVRRRGIAIDGSALRELRKRRALTQSQLAIRADLSMLTVSNAERRGFVDASTLRKLTSALQVDVDALHANEIEEEVLYQSVFISYGGPDEHFARLLFDRLGDAGCDVFFFPESATPGEKLHRTMSDGVSQFDRVLIVCSEGSLGRSGVLNELERVLEREANEGGSDILIPINIDDFVFGEWKPEREDIAVQIRARVLLSFVGATGEGADFDARFNRLLKALER